MSLWLDELTPAERGSWPALDGDVTADVAIVGAGYTGLWTAYYLATTAPHLKVVVVEAEHVGFGASGRNGGWCTTEMPSLLWTLVRRYGPMPAMRLYRAGHRTLAEVEKVLANEGVDCAWRRDGTLYVARTRPQLDRLTSWLELRAKLGITDMTLLDPEQRRQRPQLAGAIAAGFTPNCAVVQPARIAYGLADAVSRRGVAVHEHTRVTQLRPRRLVTDRGVVRADVVICATEGYTGRLAGHARRILPVYSHLIATAPLPESTWESLGWYDRVTVAESRYQFGYLHRTADNRLVLGGRGAGYHFGSRSGPRYDHNDAVSARQRECLTGFFPSLSDVEITHSWGGAYGLHRNTEPAVVFDRSTGLGYAGGYGGEGIALSNLAARTLTALILGEDRPETRLCWTNHPSRRWEPEPLRYLGVRGVSALALRADAYEDRSNRSAPLASLAIKAVQ